MGSSAHLIIFALSVVLVHFTKANIIEDALVKNSKIYYKVPPQFGGESEILLQNVDKLHGQGRVIFISHGYVANRFHDSIIPAINGVMSTGEYIVLVADWRYAAKLTYPHSRALVGPVGRLYGEMLLEFSIKHNIPRSRIACVGHSLGAHICGNVGKFFNGTLGEIYGLDPAKPMIKVGAPDSLQQTDALRVINIHTGSPAFGELTPLGHIDIYPNYGSIPQPGCMDAAMTIDLIAKRNACSHNRSPQLFGEGVQTKKNLPAVPCDFEAIRKKSAATCRQNKVNVTRSSLQKQIAEEDENADIIYISLDIPEKFHGTYILDTNERAPFGMGVYSQVPQNYS